jgi:hypothetical protein
VLRLASHIGRCLSQFERPGKPDLSLRLELVGRQAFSKASIRLAVRSPSDRARDRYAGTSLKGCMLRRRASGCITDLHFKIYACERSHFSVRICRRIAFLHCNPNSNLKIFSAALGSASAAAELAPAGLVVWPSARLRKPKHRTCFLAHWAPSASDSKFYDILLTFPVLK